MRGGKERERVAGREEIVWPERESVYSGKEIRCVAGRRARVAGRKETVWPKGKRVGECRLCETSRSSIYKHWSRLKVQSIHPSNQASHFQFSNYYPKFPAPFTFKHL